MEAGQCSVQEGALEREYRFVPLTLLNLQTFADVLTGCYTKAILHNPEDPLAYGNRAQAYLKLDKWVLFIVERELWADEQVCRRGEGLHHCAGKAGGEYQGAISQSTVSEGDGEVRRGYSR